MYYFYLILNICTETEIAVIARPKQTNKKKNQTDFAVSQMEPFNRQGFVFFTFHI